MGAFQSIWLFKIKPFSNVIPVSIGTYMRHQSHVSTLLLGYGGGVHFIKWQWSKLCCITGSHDETDRVECGNHTWTAENSSLSV